MCDLYVNVHKQLKGDNFNNMVTGLDDTYCNYVTKDNLKKYIIQKIPCEMVKDADIICLKVCILEKKSIFI